MKRILILIVCALMAAALFCTGCGGVYTPPIVPEQGGNQQGGGGQEEPPEEGFTFTVNLVQANGSPFRPDPGQHIKARWFGEDGHNYEAEFNSMGVATQKGMDGDFRVTLSDIPEGYTYNSNGIYANNNRRDVSIVLLTIIYPSNGHKGTDPYQDAITMTQTGTYRATVSMEGEGLWYSFSPRQAGLYYIESWVDVSANEINPKIIRYAGTFANVNYSDYEECDDGGASSTFTKNFRMIVNCAADYIGNVWWFQLYADCVSSDLYPATVDFSISHQGEATDPEGETIVIEAQGEFFDGFDEDGTFTPFAEANVNLDTYLKQVGLNEDDHFYHMLNPDTGKYDGATVYVMLTSNTYYFSSYVAEDCEDAFLHDDYFHPEWSAEGHLHTFPLRLGVGTYGKEDFYFKDYHHFMETYTGLYREPDPVNDGMFVIVEHPDMKKCNSDGAHPVNEELKTFLQEYAKHYGIFHDGDGGGEGIGLDSSEQAMWLFACGIYQ